MLDIRLVREQPDRVRRGLESRGVDPIVVDRLLEGDERRRRLLTEVEALKARRNELSREIPQRAKAGQPIEALKDDARRIGEQIKGIEEELAAVENGDGDVLLTLPNLPHESTPVGRSEEENVVVRTWGGPPVFGTEPKPHWEIGAALGILDFERGTKISGSGFFVLKGAGARLERALIQWMLDTHTEKNGYTEIAPPFAVNRAALVGTTQLPKFEEDLYRIQDEDLFLVPTAEVPVTNLHAGEILDASQLPIRYCAYTPCFRREAGSYGKETRGISRVHQFSKVEMVWFTKPEDSYAAHEALTKNATDLLEALGLHYRQLLLCTGDMGFGAAKCHDLEIWAPGMNRFLEVSSCSNFEDFQARRANIRFRREKGAKPELVHTLNGSGLALPRLLIALLECGQQPDGSVKLPEVLHDYFGAAEIRAAS
jgi:seryl-tRNA synthetase